MSRYERIKVETDDECFRTNRVFPKWFGDASEGGEYIDEWACKGTNDAGDSVLVVWQFVQVRGEEPEDDQLPWSDENKIIRVVQS